MLIALIAPTRSGELVSEPASTKQIAAALFVSKAAVNNTSLISTTSSTSSILIAADPVSNEALKRGAIKLSDLRAPSPSDS